MRYCDGKWTSKGNVKLGRWNNREMTLFPEVGKCPYTWGDQPIKETPFVLLEATVKFLLLHTRILSLEELS